MYRFRTCKTWHMRLCDRHTHAGVQESQGDTYISKKKHDIASIDQDSLRVTALMQSKHVL